MRFHEEQRFEGTAFKVLTAGLLLPIPLVAAVLYLAVPELRDDPFPLFVTLAAVAVVDAAIWLAVVRLRLVVEVGEDRIAVRARPFVDVQIPAAEIETVETVSKGLFKRYGAGIGKRWGDRRIRLTVGNDAGVVLKRADGWTVILGSKRSEELGEAIRNLVLAHRPELRQSEEARWWERAQKS